MVVTYGRKCPAGYLPVTSVDTEEEARELIQRCCEPVYIKETEQFGHIAQELEKEQTLPNLRAFGDRLEAEYLKMKQEKFDE